MDPLSVIASVIAILKLTNEIVNYLHDVQDAPEKCRQCAMEASNLSGLLTSLRYRLEDANSADPWFTSIRALSVGNGPLDQYRASLEQLRLRVTARDGLAHIKQRLQWKFSKTEVDSILQRMERLKSLIGIALKMDAFKLSQAIQEGVCDLRADTSMIKSDVAAMRDKQASQQDRTALQWLSPLDFSPQYHDIISRKEEGTGQWFLDSTEFMTWQSEAKNTLFCPGIPGAGKTMVSAIAIQNLLTRAGNEDIGLGFLFCNYKSQAEQTCAMLLATLLKQLAHGHSDATELIARMHESHERRNTRPSPEELQGALQSVCSMYPVVYLVVDALDEFVSQDRPRTELIDKLRQLQSKTDVRLLFTSRFVPEIEDDFISDSKLEVRASDEDVRTYVQGQLTRLPKCIQREIGQEVQDKIAEAVDGMFLLARLYVDSLVDKRTVKKARDTLNVLSTRSNALKLAYDDAIGRIEAQSSDDAALACKALSWIEYAQRPLTTAELCHALSIEPEERDLDSTAIYEIEDVLSVCAGLVTVDVESDIVRLVHYTTQEYLVCRLAEGWLPTARLDIAVACFTYLSMDEFRTGSCDSWREYNDRAEEFAFQKYAATYCAKHAEVVQREVWESASYFLLDENLVDAALQALAVESFYHVFPNHATGLHFTAASGSVDLTTMLLEHRDYPYGGNEKDDFDQTPLLLAAMWGHEGVVRLLIERCDVKADSADNLRYTPLLYAAEGGHEAVVRLLLQRGDVKINAKTHGDETPLLLAAESGHEAVVRLLLERNDINVNARDWDGNTPLFRAAERGREAVVRLLLERSDVDINARNQDGKTPLFRVAERGHEAVVRLLVACKDVDINARSHSGNTLLCSAVERGDEAVVRLLLERDDIDVNARDLYGKTPLFRAAERGHESVVRLLLERSDLDINAKNKRERTAVELAEYYGYEGIVRLLKDHNAQTE